jgi:hypothetical protein
MNVSPKTHLKIPVTKTLTLDIPLNPKNKGLMSFVLSRKIDAEKSV